MRPIKKIIHIIPGFLPVSRGGAEYFALNLCRGLKKRGIDPIVVTRRYSKLSATDSINEIVIRRFRNILPNLIKRYAVGLNLRSKYLRMFVAFFDVIGAIILLMKLIRKYDVKILHSSFIVPTGFIGVLLKKFMKIRLIITVHGPADFYTIPKFLRKFLLLILNRADSVITVSKHLELDMRGQLGLKNIKTILNGVKGFDVSEYNNLKTIKGLNINRENNRPIVISTGRLVKIKRIELLIKSLEIVKRSYPNLKAIILGEGIERENIERLIDKLELRKNVIMPGWVSEMVKRKCLAISNIFVHLSREEGLSLSLLESQMAGLPAVVPDTAFASEVIKHNYNGIYVKEPLKPKNIAEKIILLINDEERLNKMKKRSKKVFKRFTLDKMVENYMKAYKNLK